MCQIASPPVLLSLPAGILLSYSSACLFSISRYSSPAALSLILATNGCDPLYVVTGGSLRARRHYDCKGGFSIKTRASTIPKKMETVMLMVYC